jgi:nondiscriminating glutamyl-tRNA synthetase
LNEISGYIDMFVDEKYHVSREAAEILRGNTVAEILKALHEVLTQSEISRKNFYSTLIHSVREKTGLKAKSILMPLRAAVTGRTSGPELEKIFSILGKESILKRLEQARQFMEM